MQNAACKEGRQASLLHDFLMLAKLPLLLKGVIVDHSYKLALKKCKFTNNVRLKLASSLAMCPAFCTSSSFVRRFTEAWGRIL